MAHVAGHIPQTGLIGSEQALQAGLGGALTGLEFGFGQARGDIQAQLELGQGAAQQLTGAQQPFEAFVMPGQQAAQQQAALSGALGPEAQAQFFQNFQQSPGQQFQQQRQRQALLRSSAAIGGLGGGNVRTALQEQAAGFAAGDIGQEFNRLSIIAQQGLAGAGQQAGLAGQQAGLGAGLAQTGAGLLGGLGQRGGEAAANLIFGTGQQVAGGRTRVGELQAAQQAATTSALSNLIAQQGAGISDIIGAGGGNLANILQTLGQQTGLSQENLAQILANLSQGQASQVAGLPAVGQFFQAPNTLGQIGQLAGGIGGILSALPPPQQQAA